MPLTHLKYFVFSTLIFMSCNSRSRENEVVKVDTNLRADVITSHDIDNLKYTDYILSNDSQKAVIDWQKYQELYIQLGFLKTADMSFFNGEKLILKKFMNELKTEIPEAINTEIIQSRLIALETKMLKFNSVLHLENIPKTEQLSTLKEFLVAAANLKLQINKKLELDANNILKPQ